jgi:hypothetical protein
MAQNVDMVTNPPGEFLLQKRPGQLSVLERVARDSMHFTKVAEKTPTK